MFWLAPEPVPYYSCCFLFWPASQSASLLIFCQAFYLCITKHHLNLLSILLFFIFFFLLSRFALLPWREPLMLFESLQSACQVVDVFTQTGRENGKWVTGLGNGDKEKAEAKAEAMQPVLQNGGVGVPRIQDPGSSILHPSRVPSASACAFITFQLLYEILQIRFISMHWNTFSNFAAESCQDVCTLTQTHTRTPKNRFPKKDQRESHGARTTTPTQWHNMPKLSLLVCQFIKKHV